MGLRVNQNIMALTAHRNLQVTDWQLAKSIERLSSGLKVNRASDDPAIYVQSELMRTQIKGTEQAITNLTDAISMVQTIEGTYDEIESLIRTIRTLAIHAANTGPNDVNAIQADQDQINSAIDSLNTIATTRKYGTKVLLNGDLGGKGFMNSLGAATASFVNVGPRTTVFQVGKEGVTSVSIRVSIITTATQTRITMNSSVGGAAGSLGADETVNINGVSILLASSSTPTQVMNTINLHRDRTGVTASLGGNNTLALTHNNYGSQWQIFASSDRVGADASGLGGGYVTTAGTDVSGSYTLLVNANSLTFAATGYGQYLVALGGTQDAIIGNITKKVTLDGLRIQYRETASVADAGISIANSYANFQIGPNRGEDVRISVQNARPSNLGYTQRLSEVDVRSEQGAQMTIRVAEEALLQVLSMRANIGAFQKQFLESTKGNLMVHRENIATAESNVRDTDMAAEMISFTRHQILMQSGTAMLAQANLAPQSVLQLLR